MTHSQPTSARRLARLPWLAALLGSAAISLPSHADLRIQDGLLLEANGTPFVMRGVNAAHVWYPDKTDQTLKDIAARGANTVRLVLANGVRWTRTDEATVRDLIAKTKAAKLIAVLEVHDTTGYGEQGGASTLDQAVDYWVSIKNALIGQEDYVIVNIGNEPLGNGQAGSIWVDGHKNAIAKLRAAGIKNTLMVDGANWGQDWQGIMKSNAAQVFASDPLRNTVFSVHMYAVYATESSVNDYLNAFRSARLPIVVGEFGNAHQGQPVAATAIMRLAQQYGIGYLAWSWSGNGGGDEPLDMVNGFNGASLTPWGSLAFNDANGITATAKRASIFNAGPTLPGAPAPTATAGNASVALSWAAVSGATSYEVARGLSFSGPFTGIAAGLTGTSYNDSGLTNNTNYFYRVAARNSAGATASPVVSATPKAGGGGGGGACTLTVDGSNDWGNGQVTRISLVNTGTTSLADWTISVTESNNFSVQNSWNANLTQAGRVVTLTPVSWNRTVAPGASVEAGMQIAYSGAKPVAVSASSGSLGCAVTLK